jgi:acyl-coenzyme A synthetase/AMP-(fatty) acid ligase
VAAAPFNVSEYLLDRHVRAGRGDRIALTGAAGEMSYAELTERVSRAAAGLRGLGLQPEQRVVMVMADSPEFVITYLAAIRIGAVPVPISTMLRPDGIAEILIDSRARVVALSGVYRDAVASALSYPGMTEVMAVVTDDAAPAAPVGGRPATALSRLPVTPDTPDGIYPTTADSPAFWLYTSGTTGTPKGAMHRHGSVQVVCETYGTQVLGITPEDRCLSAAKAFFAYGLGNSVLFPLSVGATARRRYGLEVPPGTSGTLFVRGASAATGYWSRYDASRQVFQGEWLRTGDTYVVDADGYYACLGRTGDMLKASGIWVSPAEVESRLLAHADVAQAVVVAANDPDGLEKPVAFVQLNPGCLADEQALIAFCKLGLPSFKRPRRVVFVTEYPTTATGKIRRVELRTQAAVILQAEQAHA